MARPKPRGKSKITDLQQALKHALWLKGELDWKLNKYQKEVYDIYQLKKHLPGEMFVWNMSRRWGKSFLLSIIAIEYALKNPGSTILFTASTQKQIKQAIKENFDVILKDCPKEIFPLFKTQAQTYDFANGSSINFAGIDKERANSLRGRSAHLVVCDEAGFCDNLKDVVLSVLSPFVATTRGQILLASNAPLSPAHDFVSHFKPRAEKNGNYLLRTVYDTTFTPEEIAKMAENAGGFESTTFQREYLCKLTVDSSRAIIPEFGDVKDQIVTTVEKPAFFRACVAIDLAYKDNTACLFAYYDYFKAKIVIADEIIFSGQNSKTITDACKLKEKDVFGDVVPARVCDAQLYTVNDLATVHSYPISCPVKPSLEAQVNQLRNDIKNGKILIDPKCIQLIHELETGLWNKQKTAFERTAENHNDSIAALSYLVRAIDQHSDPYPPGYGFHPGQTFLRPYKKSIPSHEAIKSLFKKL
jgi:hypothetical protein